MKQLLVIFLTLFIGVTAIAGVIPTPTMNDVTTKQQPNIYQIELVIFTYNTEEATEATNWQPFQWNPTWQSAIQLKNPYANNALISNSTNNNSLMNNQTSNNQIETSPNSLTQTNANAMLSNPTNLNNPQFFTVLPQQDWLLTKEVKRLQRFRQYTIIAHIAWIQPIPKSWKSQTIHITGGSLVNYDNQQIPNIDGTIKISRQNYVNLTTNLMLNEATQAGMLSFPLNDKRRVKTDQLNYLDNPVFGVLVMVKQLNNNNNKQPTQLAKLRKIQ